MIGRIEMENLAILGEIYDRYLSRFKTPVIFAG
jgi:hypothetical protein